MLNGPFCMQIKGGRPYSTVSTLFAVVVIVPLQRINTLVVSSMLLLARDRLYEQILDIPVAGVTTKISMSTTATRKKNDFVRRDTSSICEENHFGISLYNINIILKIMWPIYGWFHRYQLTVWLFSLARLYFFFKNRIKTRSKLTIN